MPLADLVASTCAPEVAFGHDAFALLFSRPIGTPARQTLESDLTKADLLVATCIAWRLSAALGRCEADDRPSAIM